MGGRFLQGKGKVGEIPPYCLYFKEGTTLLVGHIITSGLPRKKKKTLLDMKGRELRPGDDESTD